MGATIEQKEKRRAAKERAQKAHPHYVPAFANVPDSAFNVFRCSGCGGEDVSMWSKDGLEHWADQRTVCGTYSLVEPFEEKKAREQAALTAWHERFLAEQRDPKLKRKRLQGELDASVLTIIQVHARVSGGDGCIHWEKCLRCLHLLKRPDFSWVKTDDLAKSWRRLLKAGLVEECADAAKAGA